MGHKIHEFAAKLQQKWQKCLLVEFSRTKGIKFNENDLSFEDSDPNRYIPSLGIHRAVCS